MTGPSVPAQASVLMLDACCILNLVASRHMEAIIRCLSMRCAVATAAAGEALWVERGGSGPDATARDPVDLQPLIDAGLLVILSVDTDDEMAAYVTFAASLDDGEAMTCAIAVERGYAVASDDHRVANVLKRLAPQIPILTTPSLLKHWAETSGIAPPLLKQVLTDVHDRARYAPGRHDPLQSWWQTIADR